MSSKYTRLRLLALSLSVLSLLVKWSDSYSLEGGEAATGQQTQGIVAISYKDQFYNCVGIVLEPTRVLTTASCINFVVYSADANDIRVHPLLGDEIGGNFSVPIVNEGNEPFVGVTSVALHPDNTSGFGPYNLAVLKLDEPLTLPPQKLLFGNETFVGDSATAFGWLDVERQGAFLTLRFYQPNTIELPSIVEGDSNANSIGNGCYDSFVDTDTVFCAGFRSTEKFLESEDRGSPIYRSVSGENVVLGLLSDPSNGFELNGAVGYEVYARISSMTDFIKAQAPNTQFVEQITEDSESTAIVPVITILLDD